MLIEQAEALGEPPEDPLLLFSVLYGFWVANYVAFNGDVMRELAAQFLALAEKQGATVPLMIGHRLMGNSLAVSRETSRKAGRTSIRRSRFTILPSIVRWRRDLAKTSGCQSCPIGRWALWLLGYPEAALADAEHALKDAREIGQAATLMFALTSCIIDPYSTAEITRQQTRKPMNLSRWRTKRAHSFWKAHGMMNQGCLLALTGKASDAVQMITSGITACGQREQRLWMPLYLSYLARPMRSLANSMTLGAALAKR